MGLQGTPEQIAEGLMALSAAGADHITCMLRPPTMQGIERFARVIEVLRTV
jgi:alkanesulfonate monooxygenase SsuD/methylene tetrahydromethanopterin reductase-like flavin-dependent oxidoreductase (luciferase family)